MGLRAVDFISTFQEFFSCLWKRLKAGITLHLLNRRGRDACDREMLLCSAMSLTHTKVKVPGSSARKKSELTL